MESFPEILKLFNFGRTIEKLVVIRELGVHIHTKYWSGKENSIFVDKTRIKAVVINEGYRIYTVITYLAFIVEGEGKLICAFQVCFSLSFFLSDKNSHCLYFFINSQHLFPRMNVIMTMYQETRELLEL